MYNIPTEISLEAAKIFSQLPAVGQLWAFGGGGFDLPYLLIYTADKVLFCPQEFLTCSHGQIGSSIDSDHPLVKEFLDSQAKELIEYLTIV